ncbi:LOW QUALITY PROTEIN: ninjurin-2 [Trachypithecus francoisi]|uniref:LOW QUALITY PROTEIN: ninjurin-2 n=1 Tax=Trachypithecus francoisi TaxID=54180 RepID=UPI00141B5F6C|nr:LOW QUALITY PROTEIN: ninjurin-2 [Trachypithecus francoisi]
MAGLSRQLCALSHPKKAAETQTAEPGGAHAVCSQHPVRVKGLEDSEMESEREIINLQPGSSDPRRNQPINLNHYATKKSVAESMLDVALFMSNAMRLKAVLEQGPSSHYYITLVTLLSLSLLLQVAIGVLLVVIARLNLNEVEKQWRLNQLNNVATVLVFFTVVINVFITAFGAHKTGFLTARASRNPL